MSKELNKAPVEQAGGDERATLAHRSEFHQHLKECADEVATWPSYKREALTQPSPAPELERPEVVAYRTIGRHEKHQHPHYALNYYKQNAEDQAAHWRERGCEVSEDELMTVTQHARIVGALRAENTKLSEALDECDGDRWKLRSERDAANARLHEVATACATAEQQRDAALARAAELEKQEPVALANRGLHAFWVKWTEAAAGLYGPGIKLYAAPVAQAQHSVPDGFREKFKQCMELAFAEIAYYVSPEKARDPNSRARKAGALATELHAMLAAAPGKEVGHE
ncbi:TPA: hypothetical protein SL444_001970 [Pseudomonas aeruginosa]|nr:hypothetical protein [Pseudomonas aeruginosa]HEJ3888403.1 hypothetical protein [Pseudomonas aeruginosa]